MNKISLKAKLILVIIILIFTFPQKIYADLTYENLRYYYLEFNEDAESWQSKNIDCPPENLTTSEKAFLIFDAFFSDGLAASVPSNVEVLQVITYDNRIVLNVSNEIKNYGGTFNEDVLVRQLIKTALAIPNVTEITLLIEGEEGYLPEGSHIFNEAAFLWEPIQ